MAELSAHGLHLRLPDGWEGFIYRRPVELDESTFAILHAATCPLPAERGDFGRGAVERMRSRDVFLSLFEYGSDGVGQALFAPRGLPLPLNPDDFHPETLQYILPGQAGLQRFFTSANRTFGLYVVLGSFRRRWSTVPLVNEVLATLRIDPLEEEP